MGLDPLISSGSGPCKRVTESRSLVLITNALCGAVFGFVMQKGHVYEPGVIRGQMLFQDWNMMKMFLAAVSTSVAAIALVALLNRSLVVSARAWAFSGYRGTIAALLGGMILGIGMSLAGACPGTVLIQVGAGVRYSILTVAGAFCGAFVFALLEPGILRNLGVLRAGMLSKPTWDSLIGVKYAFFFIAAVMSLVYGGAAYYIENSYPSYRSFFFKRSNISFSFTASQWPSWFSGIIVGCLQIPLLLFAKETLGASRAYVTIVSNILATVFPNFVNRNSYLLGAKSGNSNYGQVLFIFFACIGSFISCLISGTSFSAVSGFIPLSSFIGGFFIIFGARLAGGCTSGQGISGNGVLAINGMLVTIGIFAGGIPMAKFAQINGF